MTIDKFPKARKANFWDRTEPILLNRIVDTKFNIAGYLVMGENGKIYQKDSYDGPIQNDLKNLYLFSQYDVIQHRESVDAANLNKNITLYHGNKDKNMIPAYGRGKTDNDYGQGFYTTPDLELAKEWAYAKYSKGSIGFVHSYEIDLSQFNVLDFTKYDSMHWLAELLVNRTLDLSDDSDGFLQDRIEQIIKHFKIDTSSYDVIIGYRADDSYFSYALDFVRISISKETLDRAFRLGDLGLQVFIKSEAAFECIKKCRHCCCQVDAKYAEFYARRDRLARTKYIEVKRERLRTKHSVLDVLKGVEDYERTLL